MIADGIKLKGVLSLLGCTTIPWTIGTKDGERWIYYCDGKQAPEISINFMDRDIVEIYIRPARQKDSLGSCCELKAGYGVIIEGNENGQY